jgi:hypothetical protein
MLIKLLLFDILKKNILITFFIRLHIIINKRAFFLKLRLVNQLDILTASRSTNWQNPFCSDYKNERLKI